MSSLEWYAPNPQAVGIEIRKDPTYSSFHTGADLDDPVENADTTDYELGNLFGAFSAGPRVYGVRIWSGGNDTGLATRKARLWQIADRGDVVNTKLTEVALPANLPSGWTQVLFPVPVTLGAAANGDWYCVSYPTTGKYGNITNALGSGPDDGVLQYTASGIGSVAGAGSGRFSLTQGHVPDNATDSFYIDVVYLP